MAAFICDANAIVKRYVSETGSAWVRALADQPAAHEIFLTHLARVEVVAAVARRARGGSIPSSSAAALIAQFRHDAAHQYNILEVTPVLLAGAERLAELHALRGYDAEQLAVTVELDRARSAAGLGRLTLLCADQELNMAAAAAGLIADDPNTHP
jgi:predicted nucleic acid-binding protein